MITNRCYLYWNSLTIFRSWFKILSAAKGTLQNLADDWHILSLPHRFFAGNIYFHIYEGDMFLWMSYKHLSLVSSLLVFYSFRSLFFASMHAFLGITVFKLAPASPFWHVQGQKYSSLLVIRTVIIVHSVNILSWYLTAICL